MLTDHPLIGLQPTGTARPVSISIDPNAIVLPSCSQLGHRELPPIVAAAVLLTIDYAGPTKSGAPGVSGCLPEHLCVFDGIVWHDTWTSDGNGIWMTPVGGGGAVRFASHPGFEELCRATGMLVAALGPRIREMVLLAHPSMEVGEVVEDHIVAPLLAEFGGRFSALVVEVWCDIREAAQTAHGRMVLTAERGMIEAADR